MTGVRAPLVTVPKNARGRQADCLPLNAGDLRIAGKVQPVKRGGNSTQQLKALHQAVFLETVANKHNTLYCSDSY